MQFSTKPSSNMNASELTEAIKAIWLDSFFQLSTSFQLSTRRQEEFWRREALEKEDRVLSHENKLRIRLDILRDMIGIKAKEQFLEDAAIEYDDLCKAQEIYEELQK